MPFLDGRYAFVAFTIPFYLTAEALGLLVDLTLNIVTAAVASVSVALRYFIVSEMTGDWFDAVAAALLFSFMSMHFSGYTHTMIHTFSVYLVLLAFYLMMLGYKRNSAFRYGLASTTLMLVISARFPNILLIPSLVIVYPLPTFKRWTFPR